MPMERMDGVAGAVADGTGDTTADWKYRSNNDWRVRNSLLIFSGSSVKEAMPINPSTLTFLYSPEAGEGSPDEGTDWLCEMVFITSASSASSNPNLVSSLAIYTCSRQEIRLPLRAACLSISFSNRELSTPWIR